MQFLLEIVPVERLPAFLSRFDGNGFTALMVAAYYGNVVIVEELLKVTSLGLLLQTTGEFSFWKLNQILFCFPNGLRETP